MSQSCEATIKSAQMMGGGLQSPGVICGPIGIRGPAPVLQNMKTPEEIINKPELEEVDIERINFTLRQLADTISKAENHMVYIGGPARFTNDSEDSMWIDIGGTAKARGIFLAKYWEVVKMKLETAGWEVTRVRRWFNDDHPYMFSYWTAKYWRVRPSLESFLNVSVARHLKKETPCRTMCEEMGVSEMGETA